MLPGLQLELTSRLPILEPEKVAIWQELDEGIYNCTTADPYYDFKVTMNSIDNNIAICEFPISKESIDSANKDLNKAKSVFIQDELPFLMTN